MRLILLRREFSTVAQMTIAKALKNTKAASGFSRGTAFSSVPFTVQANFVMVNLKTSAMTALPF